MMAFPLALLVIICTFFGVAVCLFYAVRIVYFMVRACWIFAKAEFRNISND
jgi:hypothetical protein